MSISFPDSWLAGYVQPPSNHSTIDCPHLSTFPYANCNTAQHWDNRWLSEDLHKSMSRNPREELTQFHIVSEYSNFLWLWDLYPILSIWNWVEGLHNMFELEGNLEWLSGAVLVWVLLLSELTYKTSSFIFIYRSISSRWLWWCWYLSRQKISWSNKSGVVCLIRRMVMWCNWWTSNTLLTCHYDFLS